MLRFLLRIFKVWLFSPNPNRGTADLSFNLPLDVSIKALYEMLFARLLWALGPINLSLQTFFLLDLILCFSAQGSHFSL